MLLKGNLITAFELIIVATLATSAQASPADKNSTQTDDAPSSRIINGNTGSWANYPSLVSLRVNGGHSCGGALLNANTVLTAAHCSEVSTGSVSVRAYSSGSLQKRQWWPQQQQNPWWPQQQQQNPWWPQQPQRPQQPQQPQQPQRPQQPQQGQVKNGPDGPYTEHRVSQIIKHPSYNSGGYIKYDVAIWKLATPVSARNFYQIDTQNVGDRENSATKFAGWGRVDPNDQRKLASQLQEANLPVYPFNTCNAAYQGLSKPHHLCAGYREGRSAVCQGDSGGPLVIGNTIIGVTSFVRDLRCLNPNFPSVFARVNTYAQWIQQYVR
ncbi:trypsin-like serine protease [Neoconidiobolus thromboides FSU 785]|nr:trypsin-like serine protease [Neoconidiobolus thromboides FSU 785]